MIKVLRKLKGRSLSELRVRGGQAAACLAERAGLSADARVPGDAALYRWLDKPWFQSDHGEPLTPESLSAHFRSTASHPFFAAFNDSHETRAALGSRFGGRARELLVERAERIVAGKFDLLGLSGLDFGDPVDWHLEPIAAKRTSLAHWSRIDYLNAAVAGDKKITWELNRQQYFAVLGRAYWHTGDERYAETFARHLAAWMQANPPKRGINWASSLEVAFRAISWLWSLQFFKHSPHLTNALYARALKFLYLHARHLETNLSTYFSPNTHLTGEALGLFYLGTLLPEFRAAARWRATGARILFDQLERQVRPDGVYFEQSSYYQRYTTDFYTHFLALLRAGGDGDATRGESREEVRGELPQVKLSEVKLLEEKLQALLDHLMHLTLPDGTTPLFGDEDGGRLTWFDERAPNDFRQTLANGASLFRRGDYKHVARAATEETLWLLGARGLSNFDALEAHAPAGDSRAFHDGGYYVMRDGWDADSNYLLLDCGPHGSLNGAHAHADALALLGLAARGRHLLVDSGTYTYTGSSALREHFRGTAAHNTLVVDNQSSSVPESAFRWRQQARASCRQWLSRARFDLFEGAHDGYERLDAPVTHTRSVLFVKGDYWIVRDRVETPGTHDYALNFHFDARTELSIAMEDGAAVARTRAGNDDGDDNGGGKGDGNSNSVGVDDGNGDGGNGNAAGLDLFAFARGGVWRKHEALRSACYGEAVPAPVCTLAFAGGAQEVFTLLVPRGGAQDKESALETSTREIEAVGGRAFELRIAGGATRDLLLVRAEGASAIETARLASNFAWTWLRFDGDDETEPRELIAVGGGSLSLDGREILRARQSGARLNYVTARRAGDEFTADTDAGEDFFLALSGARHDEELIRSDK
ncbi:MAG: hypothetical protein QOE47_2958 [Pyrinomonadaceae bacterium]|nr:hypothetical protein [Pyrinomonadaceae bacterium]